VPALTEEYVVVVVEQKSNDCLTLEGGWLCVACVGLSFFEKDEAVKEIKGIYVASEAFPFCCFN
jgi:hypothetical protein